MADAGAEVVAIACNTAHFWHQDLQRETKIPVLHIADAVLDAVAAKRQGERVGLLGTESSVMTIYRDRVLARGFDCLVPTEREFHTLINPAIELAKRGQFTEAAIPLACVSTALMERGADTLILGCTELPLISKAIAKKSEFPFVDPAVSLAQICLTRSRWSADSKMDPSREGKRLG